MPSPPPSMHWDPQDRKQHHATPWLQYQMSPQTFHRGGTTHQPHKLRGGQVSLGHCRNNKRRCLVGRVQQEPWQTQVKGTCLPGGDLSGEARMSQRKMASPTLRSCCWSGVKATACTGSEWPMYTWGQHMSHTENPEAWLNGQPQNRPSCGVRPYRSSSTLPLTPSAPTYARLQHTPGSWGRTALSSPTP